MALSYSPKVGELLECDFGEYVNPPFTPKYNGLIANEIRKRRMVVVLNGKLPNNCCLVIPVSSTGNADSEMRGYHVHIDSSLVTLTQFYDKRDRWAISECVTHVSKGRLFRIFNGGVPVSDILPRDVMEHIQRAAIKTLNANSLLAAPPPPAAVPQADPGGDAVVDSTSSQA